MAPFSPHNTRALEKAMKQNGHLGISSNSRPLSNPYGFLYPRFSVVLQSLPHIVYEIKSDPSINACPATDLSVIVIYHIIPVRKKKNQARYLRKRRIMTTVIKSRSCIIRMGQLPLIPPQKEKRNSMVPCVITGRNSGLLYIPEIRLTNWTRLKPGNPVRK